MHSTAGGKKLHLGKVALRKMLFFWGAGDLFKGFCVIDMESENPVVRGKFWSHASGGFPWSPYILDTTLILYCK